MHAKGLHATLLCLALSLQAADCKKPRGGSDADDAGGAARASANAGMSGKSSGSSGATSDRNAGAGGRGQGGSNGVGVGGVAAAGDAEAGAGASAGDAGNGAEPQGGSSGGVAAAACPVTSERVRVTEIDVGMTVVTNEDEAGLRPLAISPSRGGARVAWMGDDEQVHVTTLDATDRLAGASVAFPAHDFDDLLADDEGGALLLTREAEGGGTLGCGDPKNLCGTPPDPPIACYDMYLVRFDGESERWATKLTSSSGELPPYSTGKTGDRVFMIWWYAHHGRIAFDGERYAAYFGDALSVSQDGCINVYQADRLEVVDRGGKVVTGGFDLGCSHSGYERVVWDTVAGKFIAVCKTDNDDRIAFAPNYTTIYPVDLYYSNVGGLVLDGHGGYWLTLSNIRSGQPAATDGLADVHLLHFSTGRPDRDLVVARDDGKNDRAPHLAAFARTELLAAWESSSKPGDLAANDASRQLYVQARDGATGAAVGQPVPVGVKGNRYQDFVAFPDGSVAYAAPGSSPTKLAIVRVLPCE